MNTSNKKITEFCSTGNFVVKMLMLALLMSLASITDSKSQSITMTWDSGFDGTITYRESISSTYQVGGVLDQYRNGTWGALVTQTVDDGNLQQSNNRSTEREHITDSEYPGFESVNGLEYELGEAKTNTYGTWYLKAPRVNFRVDLIFVANEAAIRDNLSPGQFAVSKVKYYLRENGQEIASDEISVTIKRPKRPFVSVYNTGNSINSGESTIFGFRLTESGGKTIHHHIDVTWSPANLVSSVKCGTAATENVMSGATTKRCSSRIYSAATEQISTDRIQVVTNPNAQGTITATLNTDQDFSSLLTYEPQYNPNDVSTSARVFSSTSSLAVNWQPGFDGQIKYDGISIHPTYQVGEVFDQHFGGSTSVSVVEKKGSMVLNTATRGFYGNYLNDSDYQYFTADDQREERISPNFTYGVWYRKGTLDSGCGLHYCPSFLYLPNEETISDLAASDVVTSEFTFTISDGPQVLNGTAVVTISHDTSELAAGFEFASRSIVVEESETAMLNVITNSVLNAPITIPYTITPVGKTSNSDFIAPNPASITIDSGKELKILSIPLNDDNTSELNEEFTVTLGDGSGYKISPNARVATVKIIDDDRQTSTAISGGACSAVMRPGSVNTVNTRAYWKDDDTRRTYYHGNQSFTARMEFKEAVREQTDFNYGVYLDNGMPENVDLSVNANVSSTGEDITITKPGTHTGQIRYRIRPTTKTNDEWYAIDEPCEFYVWWTDANRPGISLAIEQDTVPEGRSFKVIATATPAPNRDLVVPVSVSDTSRIEGSGNFNITIEAGQTTGHMDVLTRHMSGDQEADEITATTEWRSTFWLDSSDSVKSDSITILDHDKNIVKFKNSPPDITVNETETAELVVELEGANTSGVTVKYRIDKDSADRFDYRKPANTTITIATGSEGTISIPIVSDTDYEETESFTVTLVENDDALPADDNIAATVTILSDDAPSILPPTNRASCDAVDQPQAVTTPNTQVYWETVASKVYYAPSEQFIARMGFREPSKVTTNYYFGILFSNGEAENTLNVSANANANGVDIRIGRPGNHRGHFRYRIEPTTFENNHWYDVTNPCEFHVWWVDANKPGIALSVDKKSVTEGNSFRVTATATPAPRNDIFVPIFFSDNTRIVDSQDLMVKIEAGQTSGYADISTKLLSGNQAHDQLAVSTEWRSSYWLDESVSSAEIFFIDVDQPVSNPLIFSISADSRAIWEGTATEFALNTSIAPVNNQSFTNDVTISWQPAGLVKSVCGHNPASTVNSITCARSHGLRVSKNSQGRSFIRKVTVITNDSILSTTDGSITATLDTTQHATGSLMPSYVPETSVANVSVKNIPDNLPVLSISATSGVLDEGPNVSAASKFTITSESDSNPGSSFKVYFKFTESGGDYFTSDDPNTIRSGLISFSSSGDDFTGTFSTTDWSRITDDMNSESSGTGTVTLVYPPTTALPTYIVKAAPANSASVTVYDDDSNYVSLLVSDQDINEGENTQIEYKLTSSSGHTLRHNIKLTWEPAGLVSAVKCGNTAEAMRSETEAEISCATTMFSTRNIQYTQNKIIVKTRSTVLVGRHGTITATLDTDQYSTGLQNPTFLPRYKSHEISKSVQVYRSQVQLAMNWLSGFDGVINADLNSTTYSYQVAHVSENGGTHLRSFLVEEKNGDDVVTKNCHSTANPPDATNFAESSYPEFTGDDVMAVAAPPESGTCPITRLHDGNPLSATGTAFNFGQWYVRETTSGFVPGSTCSSTKCYHLLFVPNAVGINQLSNGDTAVSTIFPKLVRTTGNNGDTLQIIREDVSVPVTINTPSKPQIEVYADYEAHDTSRTPTIYADDTINLVFLTTQDGFDARSGNLPLASDLSIKYTVQELDDNGMPITGMPANGILAAEAEGEKELFLAKGLGNPTNNNFIHNYVKVPINLPVPANADGAFKVTLINTDVNYTVGDFYPDITVTVVPKRTISIDSAVDGNGISEGHSFDFTLTRKEGDTDVDIVIPVTVTRSGTGKEDVNIQNSADRSITSGDSLEYNLTIPVGKDSVTETITLASTSDVESTDSVQIEVSISDSDSSYIADSDNKSITVDVKDNDGATASSPNLSIAADSSSVEEGETLTFTVTASVASGSLRSASTGLEAINVHYKVEANGDFIADGQNFAPVELLGNSDTVSITVNSKVGALVGSSKTVTVTLLDGQNYTLKDTVASAAATVTLTDTSSIFVSIADVSEDEGDGSGTTAFTFTVSLSVAATGNVSFDWTTSDGTAIQPDDYTTSSGTGVTITAGNMEHDLTVLVAADDNFEPDENFTVTLSNLESTSSSDVLVAADLTATGTIENDDDGIGVSIGDVAMHEGNSGSTTAFIFTVNLSKAATGNVSFDWTTSEVTAMQPADYTSASGTGVTISAGDTEAELVVMVIADIDFEPDEEFTVTLSNVTSSDASDTLEMLDLTATGTIRNDDGIGITIGDVSMDEGDGSGATVFTFSVNLSDTTVGDVTFDWSTSDDTALKNSDYTSVRATNTLITSGSTNTEIQVMVTADDEAEPDEEFKVTLSNIGSTSLSDLLLETDIAATGTIENDDGIGVSIADVSMAEGDGSGTTAYTFSLTLTEPAVGSVTFDWTTSDGSAEAGTDYTTAGQSGETIAIGDTSAELTVMVSSDDDFEPNEEFSVVISNVRSDSSSDVLVEQYLTATGLIENDDGIGVSIADVSMAEGNGNGTTAFTFTVQLSNPAIGDLYVDWNTSDDTAVQPEDYTMGSGVGDLIQAGDTEFDIVVLVAADEEIEPTEQFTVTITGVVSTSSMDSIVETDYTALGIIENDDSIEVRVADISMDEGDSGENTAFTFKVTLSATAQGNVSFDWATADGSATAGTDYTTNSGAGVQITAGGTEAEFVVMVTGDDIPEPDEEFTVTLSNVTSTSSSDRLLEADLTASATIENDDGIGLSVEDATVREGDNGETASLTFTVKLTENAPTGGVAFSWTTSDGTAMESDNDYMAVTNGTGTVAMGTDNSNFSVTVTGDDTIEPNETLSVIVTSTTTDVTVTDGTAEGTIVNDDGIQLSIDDAMVAEGASGDTSNLQFTVRLSENAPTGGVSFNWSTTDGTAKSDTDYTAITGGTGAVPEGIMSVMVTVEVTGDDAIEPNETLKVIVSNPMATGKTVVLFDNEAEGTITNDDGIGLSVEDASTDEGDAGETPSLTFTVKLTENAPTGGVAFTWTTSDGTAKVSNNDYVPETNGTGTVPMGTDSTTFSVTVTGDDTAEPDETLTVIVSTTTTDVTVTDGSAEGTIVSDDGIQLNIDDAIVAEGATGDTSNLNFTVRLSESAPTGGVSFNWSTTDGTAMAGTDYIAVTGGTGSVSEGMMSGTVTVEVTGDDTIEPSETLTVTVSSPTATGKMVVLADSEAEGTITNDDGIGLSVEDASVNEGGSGETTSMTFTVKLTENAPTGGVTFTWMTSDGTATVSDNDYTEVTNGTGTVPMGTDSTTFSVTLTGDDTTEPNETLTVVVSSATATGTTVAITTGMATGTILNDDGIGLSVEDMKVDEGAEGETTDLIFTVTLTENAPAGGVTYSWSTSDDTAVAGSDYTAVTGGTGMINENTDSGTFTVSITGDNTPEPDETLTVMISNPVVSGQKSYIADGTAIGIIVNDDGIGLSVADMHIEEGDEGETPDLIFAVTLTENAPIGGISFDWSTGDLTAESGTDYTAVTSGTGMVASGTTTGLITIQVTGDNRDESDETLTVTVSNPVAVSGDRVIVTDGTAHGTIIDDDSTVIRSVSIRSGENITRGEVAEFMFTCVGCPDYEIMISVSQVGNNIFMPVPQTVTLSNGRATLEIPTIDFKRNNANNGSITVTILRNPAVGYAINSAENTAMVSFNANQSGSGNSGTQYSVVTHIITSILQQIPASETELNSDPVSENNPLTISIAAESNLIEEGSIAKYIITASRPVKHDLMVNVELTEQGDFINGNSTEHATIKSGTDSTVLSVATVNDSFAEADGSITATLRKDDDYFITSEPQGKSATVVISDLDDRLRHRQEIERKYQEINEANQTVLPELVDSMGAESMEVSNRRLEQTFKQNVTSNFNLANLSTIKDLVKLSGGQLNGERLNLRSLLGGSSFVAGIHPESDAVNTATVWGNADFQYLSDTDNSLAHKWTGETFTTQLGFDSKIGDGLLAGLSISIVDSQANYQVEDNDLIEYDISNNGLHPYIAFSSADQSLNLSATAGYAQGEVGIDSEVLGYRTLGSQLNSIAVSGSKQLLYNDGFLGGSSSLAFTGESWLANQFIEGYDPKIENLQVRANHLRSSLEGGHQIKLASGDSIESTLAFGYLHKENNLQKFFGLQLSGDFSYENPTGLAVSTSGETELSLAENMQSMKLKGVVDYDRNRDGLGINLQISPVWSRATDNYNSRLWNSSSLNSDSTAHKNQTNIEIELGYGFHILGESWKFTPFGSMEWAENGQNQIQLGKRLEYGENLSIEISGFEDETINNTPDRGIDMKGTINW